MIETSLSSTRLATVLHRVSGRVDPEQAEQGAAEALRFVLGLPQADLLDLVLDLRGKEFQDLRAHRAWSEGCARNAALHGRIRRVAIVGDDTPEFRAERELMNAERIRFFVDHAEAERWLADGIPR
jgi:hypothetical protein